MHKCFAYLPFKVEVWISWLSWANVNISSKFFLFMQHTGFFHMMAVFDQGYSVNLQFAQLLLLTAREHGCTNDHISTVFLFVFFFSWRPAHISHFNVYARHLAARHAHEAALTNRVCVCDISVRVCVSWKIEKAKVGQRFKSSTGACRISPLWLLLPARRHPHLSLFATQLFHLLVFTVNP